VVGELGNMGKEAGANMQKIRAAQKAAVSSLEFFDSSTPISGIPVLITCFSRLRV
jgi:hypothetical protein